MKFKKNTTVAGTRPPYITLLTSTLFLTVAVFIVPTSSVASQGYYCPASADGVPHCVAASASGNINATISTTNPTFAVLTTTTTTITSPNIQPGTSATFNVACVTSPQDITRSVDAYWTPLMVLDASADNPTVSAIVKTNGGNITQSYAAITVAHGAGTTDKRYEIMISCGRNPSTTVNVLP